MKKFGLLVLMLLVCVLGVFLSPYYTLYQIKSAYEKGDYAKAVSYVDLSSVQHNATITLNARLEVTLNTNPSLATIGQLMPKLKDELANKVKDELNNSIKDALSADNLQKTLSGETTDESKKLVAMWAIASDYVDYELLIKDALMGDGQKAVKNQEPIIKQRIAKRFGSVPEDTTTRYCGMNCFEIAGGVSGVPIGIKMARVGIIGWKVDKIELP